jgi:hypothetical protein
LFPRKNSQTVSIGFRSYGAAARVEHHRRRSQPTERPDAAAE